MKLSYAISRSALKEGRYKDGIRTQTGSGPVEPDFTALQFLIMKIMTNSVE